MKYFRRILYRKKPYNIHIIIIANFLLPYRVHKEYSWKNYAAYGIKEYDFAILELQCRKFMAKHKDSIKVKISI